jgi:hypothetical protein
MTIAVSPFLHDRSTLTPIPLKVRLRHPRGVTTLQLEPETTYEELQIMIFSATEIPLDMQECEYNPRPRT